VVADVGETVFALRALFAEHQRQGAVELVYDTEVYVGRLADASAGASGA
jgi:hypothetical protein